MKWDKHEDLIDALYRIIRKYKDNNDLNNPYCISYWHFLSSELIRNTEKRQLRRE